MTFARDFDFDTIRLQFNLRLIQQMLCNIHLDCVYCTIQMLYNLRLPFEKKEDKTKTKKISIIIICWQIKKSINTTDSLLTLCMLFN